MRQVQLIAGTPPPRGGFPIYCRELQIIFHKRATHYQSDADTEYRGVFVPINRGVFVSTNRRVYCPLHSGQHIYIYIYILGIRIALVRSLGATAR